jgi:hypothetical protein
LKLLQENIGKRPEDLGRSKDFLSRTPIDQEIRTKLENGIASNYKALCMHIKGNNYQDEDTSYRMGEKSFKF